MVPQVLADFVERDFLLDAGLRERLFAADSAAEEELGRAERTEREDDILLGERVVSLGRRVSRLRELDADTFGIVAREEDLCDGRSRQDRQVRTREDLLGQVRGRG